MGFEKLDNVKPPSAGDVPADGLYVKCRKLTHSKTGNVARWIAVKMGPALCKKLCLINPDVNLSVMFGTGNDAGKIAVSVDMNDGSFQAKRDAKGGYGFTINAATADGLFSTDFPAFAVAEPDVRHREGTAPVLIFKASEPMLAVDD